MVAYIDRTRLRYGTLRVKCRVLPNTRAGKARWKCLCDCGRTVIVVSGSLSSGNTTSCGDSSHIKFAGPVARPLSERFWEKVHKTKGCWVWVGAVDNKGKYGVIRAEKDRGHVMLQAHRVSWEISSGHIPRGILVCHACDNPRCVRPDHLFLGTSKDNSQDAVCKGRIAHGERIGIAKLTSAAVRTIRKLLSNGLSQDTIADMMHVHQSTVSDICISKTWRHVP